MKFQDGANRIRKAFIGYGHLSKLYLDSYLLLQKKTWRPNSFYKNTFINFLSVKIPIFFIKYGIRHAWALHSLYIV